MNQPQNNIMLTAICGHMGLTEWIDSFVAGSNAGGQFIGLFSKHSQYTVVNVYLDSAYLLPDFIQHQAQQLADLAGAAGFPPLPRDKEAAKAAGRLHKCRNFQIARYKVGEYWRLAGVLRVAKAEQPQQAPDPTAPAAEMPPGAIEGAQIMTPNGTIATGDKITIFGKNENRTAVVLGIGKLDGGANCVMVRIDGRLWKFGLDKIEKQ